MQKRGRRLGIRERREGMSDRREIWMEESDESVSS